ncbi:MAG: argininosuccinate synthase, partial [Methanoregulaceae archaeon]|nr:argininosuccinate synthase [Methanoregulaceae archaeon]
MTANYRKFFLVTAILLLAVCMVAPAMAATTSVQIVKYASDGTTILNQTTVNYTWMEANLPVLGDGTTHYYHQGPVFIDDANETLEQELRWNPEEDTNVDTKDMGAVKGTNIKDLCDLVGGMSPGEEVKILSSDGFFKWFAYENVYGYSSREGPIGLTWYMNGNYPDSGYSDGMRLVWFADTSINPWGYHAFGNYDWYLSA